MTVAGPSGAAMSANASAASAPQLFCLIFLSVPGPLTACLGRPGLCCQFFAFHLFAHLCPEIPCIGRLM